MRQPLIARVVERLEAVGIVARPTLVLARGARLSRAYEPQLAALRAARDELRATFDRVALVGRSFGGRMCALLAAEGPPDALAVVGYPISPPGRPRPRDEATLALVRCPALVVQGERDELGPLAVLQRVAAGNPLVDIIVIVGAGHELREREEREAALHVARWLDTVLR